MALQRRAGRSLLRGDFRRWGLVVVLILAGRNSDARRASADPGWPDSLWDKFSNLSNRRRYRLWHCSAGPAEVSFAGTFAIGALW